MAELRELGFDPGDLDESSLDEEQRLDSEWLEAVRDQYPLIADEMWRAPDAVTGCDQQRACLLVLRAPFVVLIKGGNRSGKSRAMICLLIVVALGREHPIARAWCELNDIPLSLIPSGPGTVVAVAQEHSDSVLYHRPVFEELLGKLPRKWYGREADAPARCVITIPGTRVKARILFKAVAQGRGSMQGFSARMAWVDEEPLEPKGPGVIAELKMRVLDQQGPGKQGKLVISYASLSGFTWVHTRYEVHRKDRVVIGVLDALDNPHLPKDEFKAAFDDMDEDEVAQRRFGETRAKSGAVYPKWNPTGLDRNGPGHVCEPFEIPRGWPIVRAGDFGLVNPTCIGWGALGDDDTLYVFREWYRGNNESYPVIAADVADFDRSQRVVAGWGDPAASEARAVFAAHGMPMEPANNDLRTGYALVKERLRLRGDHRPRFKVFSTCPNTIREMGGLVWDPKRIDEVQLKKDDHAPDMVRYMVVGVNEWSQQRTEGQAWTDALAGLAHRLSR